jgi:hypothetical protein
MCGIERWSGLSALGAVAENSWSVAPGRDGEGALPLYPDPPLAEQRRIVDKLQQRIAWVDALEQQLTRRLSLAASVNNALNAPQAFIRSWLTRLHLRLRSLSPDRAALPSDGGGYDSDRNAAVVSVTLAL